jgi:3-oxoacyl-(acyl-carrier-protein) synthase
VWWARTARQTAAPGEGAAVFMLERRESALAAGRPPRAVLAAAAVLAADPVDPGVLAEVIARTLADAGVGPADVALAAVRATGVPEVDAAQSAALDRACPAPQLYSEREIGDCFSAHSALQLARVIDHLAGAGGAGPHTTPPAGLVVALDPDGAIGVLVVVRPDDAPNGMNGTKETHA